MAKTSAVDKAGPAVAMLIKHHFWMLAAIVPVVLLPLLFLAQGEFTARIKTVQDQIRGHISALKNVRQIPQHPNKSWASDIDASTSRVRRETFGEWRKFWEGQRVFRTWPESLGDDFIAAVTALKPDGKLSPKLLERYQNYVRTLVRELPKRMGVEDTMGDATDVGQPRPTPRPDPVRPGVGPEGALPDVPLYPAAWSTENQKRIYASFDWARPPTTRKVLLAQEELWVYGLLCDVVARMNKPASGPHNAAIAAIDELSVGYPAAEDNPGGAAGGRITSPKAALSADGMMGSPPIDMVVPGQPGMAGGRPPNPRFGGAAGMAASMPPGAEAPAATGDPDELLRNWIYVDFNGKPLDAAQLATAIDSQMVHLMPFVLRITIDQRQIDPLLVALASSVIPIDVRQVRINAGSGGARGGDPGMAAAFAAPVPGGAVGSVRLYDVNLELRGTVGLATPPQEQAVGLEPGQGDAAPSEEPGDKAAASPKAAIVPRQGRRRMVS